MSDISFLPEHMRAQEEAEKAHPKKPEQESGGLKMHVPDAVVDEDIEIIEVDEGDLAAVLSEEPFMTRFTYKLSLTFDKLKARFFRKEEAPPSKTPPQFFKPPKPGLVTKPGAVPSVQAGKEKPPGEPGRPKARITPQAEVPRRVRVIRRVRKPVRVSLITAEEIAVLSVDIGKRKWTMGVITLLFIAVIVAGHFLLSNRVEASERRLSGVEAQLAETEARVSERLNVWSRYKDLELRLTMLDEVLNTHIVISRLFDFLELRTLPSVTYSSANWGTNGTLTLDVSADSYDTAARQLVAFEESDIVTRADATSFNAEVDPMTGLAGSVVFQLLLELDVSALAGPEIVPDVRMMESASGETTEATR